MYLNIDAKMVKVLDDPSLLPERDLPFFKILDDPSLKIQFLRLSFVEHSNEYLALRESFPKALKEDGINENNIHDYIAQQLCSNLIRVILLEESEFRAVNVEGYAKLSNLLVGTVEKGFNIVLYPNTCKKLGITVDEEECVNLITRIKKMELVLSGAKELRAYGNRNFKFGSDKSKALNAFIDDIGARINLYVQGDDEAFSTFERDNLARVQALSQRRSSIRPIIASIFAALTGIGLFIGCRQYFYRENKSRFLFWVTQPHSVNLMGGIANAIPQMNVSVDVSNG